MSRGAEAAVNPHTGAPYSSRYWSILKARRRLPVYEHHQLAFVRLACLSRMEEAAGLQLLESAWTELSTVDRSLLQEHLLADGIKQVAFIFEYLPLVFQHAKQKPVVGLRRALEVLSSLVRLCREAAVAEVTGCNSVCVDLEEMAKYAERVASAKAFLSVASGVYFMRTSRGAKVHIPDSYWQNADREFWVGDSMNQVATQVQSLFRHFAQSGT